MRRIALIAALAAVVVPIAVAASRPFPQVIQLPAGFQPEGIAIGRGTTFYVGSIPTGAVFSGDLRTGAGKVLVQPQAGRAAIGLKASRDGRLFVAGGQTGKAFVCDARSGAPLAEHTLATGASFINDVALRHGTAYFTNSRAAEIFALPLGGGPVQRIALTGDFQQTGDPTATNLNGIAVAGHDTLVLVQTNTGKLFTADADSGATDEIDLGGATVVNGDGLLLIGRVLFVVQNRLNQIAVVVLSRDLSRGRVVKTITDPAFDVPTTIARAGRHLFAVNARFGIASPQTATYDVVRVP
jgi:sugar lactone lactonase YvrE